MVLQEDNRMGDWIAPLGAHPSAILTHDQLNMWISRTHQDLENPDEYTGHAVIYNSSLETFKKGGFKEVWLRCYGDQTDGCSSNFFESVNIILPFHKAGQDQDDKPLRDKPLRMAEWLDCSPLSELFGANWLWEEEALEDVLKKTWISFVGAHDRSLQYPKGEVEGEYSIAAYFAFPKNDGGKDRYGVPNKNVELLEEYLQQCKTPSHVPEELGENLRVLLGAGIDEPFSRREDGFYKYFLLIAFADRSTYTPPSPDNNNCVIKQHLAVLGRLWRNRVALPTDPGSFELIERNHDVYNTRSIRLDAFLLWSKYALKMQHRDMRTIWSIADSVNMAEVESIEKDGILTTFSPWDIEFKRKDTVRKILTVNTLSLKRWEIFPGSLYCRRRSVIESLCTNLIVPLIDIFSPDAKSRPENSLFFIAAESRAGKSKLADAIGSHLGYEIECRGRSMQIIYQRGDEVASPEILEKSLDDANTDEFGTLFIIDELQLFNGLSTFANKCYNLFDVPKDRAASVALVCLTSEAGADIEKLKQWLSEEKACREDFINRGSLIPLPSWDAEDSLVILCASILQRLEKEEIEIEKDLLEFLLVDQPHDIRVDMITFTERIARRAIKKGSTISLEELPEFSGRQKTAWRRYKKRRGEEYKAGIEPPWNEHDKILISRI